MLAPDAELRADELAIRTAAANAKAGGGGLFAQAKRDLAAAKDQPAKASGKPAAQTPGSRPAGAGTSKRVTPPKNKPTPTAGAGSRPPSTGRAARPTPPAPRGPKKK